MKPPKFTNGVISQEADATEVTDETGTSVTIAFLKMLREEGTDHTHIGLMWSPLFFVNAQMPMPDEVREMIVHTLRFHADQLESRELDKRMQELAGKMMGDA